MVSFLILLFGSLLSYVYIIYQMVKTGKVKAKGSKKRRKKMYGFLGIKKAIVVLRPKGSKKMKPSLG
jgi:hypothetical protein